MKKLFLKVCFIFISVGAFAQQEVNNTFGQQMANTFAPLEKSRVPHGLLLDIAMEFTNVPAFNGTLSDSTYVRPKSLKEIYKTLLMSRIRDVSAGFVSYDTYENNWTNQRSEDYIAISGLYFKYSRFASNAATAGKLTYSNGQIFDRYWKGRWQNPYQEMQTFAITTPIDVYTGLNFNVKLPHSIFYSNVANEIQSVAVNFDDGLGFRTVIFDQLINVSYATEGNHVWTYRLTLTNGQTLLSHSKIKIRKGLRITNASRANSPEFRTANSNTWSNCNAGATDLYRLDIQSSKTYLGVAGKARIFIDDAGNDCKITKPLIVVEGYDLASIIDPETRFSSEQYEDFVREVERAGNLSTLINGDITIPGDQEYDIIYVNWDNGMDFIERNALVVEEVVRWVNAQKAAAGSTFKNVLIGQSMGGIVCRLALLEMESPTVAPIQLPVVPHDVRLFVSQDSPQQGASMPLSIQYLYKNAVRQVVNAPAYSLFAAASNASQVLSQSLPLNSFDNPIPVMASLLDRPATKQMLINTIDGSYQLDNALHNSFYTNLNLRGFPSQQNIRNVAISNGNECGETQNFNQGDILIKYENGRKLSFLQDIISIAVLPVVGYVGSVLVDPDFINMTYLSLLPGNSKFNAFLEDRALYQNGGNKIHDLSLSYTKTILWLWPVTTYIINNQLYQPMSINKHYDNYGGGFIDIASYSNGVTLPGLFLRDKFNLVPTPSALAIKALSDTDYKLPYVGGTPPVAPLNSPFINFTTAYKSATNANKNNEKHLEFNARNGNWLAAELNGIPETTNCSFLCNSQPILGSETICNNTVYAAPSGASSYLWQIIDGNTIISLSNANSQQVTLNTNGYNGSVKLKVILNGISTTNNTLQSCGFLTKDIWIGIPQFKIFSFDNSPQTICIAAPANITFSSAEMDLYDRIIAKFDGITTAEANLNSNWQWQALSSNISIFGNKDRRSICILNGGFTSIRVRAKNSCGWSEWQDFSFEIYENPISQYRISSIYNVYPNPANNIVNIDLRDASFKPQQNITISGELFDLSGISKSKIVIQNDKASFSVQGLSKGIYVLKLYIGNSIETHNIAVE